MAVKDLIQLYESSSPNDTNQSPESPSRLNAGTGTGNSALSLPPPRRARFIHRNDEPTSRADATLVNDTSEYPFRGIGSSDLREPLSPKDGPSTLHAYPPTEQWSTGRHSHQRSQISNKNDLHPPHSPVPAQDVFARNALPLHLPKLDKYLELLKIPHLPSGDESRMFPPMDKLASLGWTLDDLENNATSTPSWRDRRSLLGTSINVLIGFLGSSALASFYSLQGLVNTVQIFALILSTIGKLPLHSSLECIHMSLVFLLVFIVLVSALLVYFYRSTTRCDRYNSIEGLQDMETKGNKWGLVITTFLLTVAYLPLSTMVIHVVVWSEELWPIPNPYRNATTLPPDLPPLGPPNVFRDPLDFCWTTTMKRNEVNLAPLMMIPSILVFILFTLWFPFVLRRVIRQSVPKVDSYTALGRPRNTADQDAEYQRLLGRDRNPFAFLYTAFRRGWGTYISTYLFAKLSTLLIIAIFDPDNCLFRNYSRTTISVIRQILLLLTTIGFFIAQCIFAPFLDPINNASEWTSRLNYLTTASTALAVTLNIPGKEILESYVLYCIYIVTYGLGFCKGPHLAFRSRRLTTSTDFSLINFGWMQRIVKKLTRRMDFSIDIFSPRLDISNCSVHTKRRIWQETVTALLLTDESCKIPNGQHIAFAQARDSIFPPYLLDFQGTPAERHVENLKILREVGAGTYRRANALLSGPDISWYRYLQDEIQKNYTGPDSYWKPLDDNEVNCRTYFGNAWWIPFPPTLVIRYDEGPYAVLNDSVALEAYIAQNSSKDVQMRRQIRMALRCLEGKLVRWPYDHVQHIGSPSLLCCGRRRYEAVTTQQYTFALLKIKRRGHLFWAGVHLGSGFQITLRYSRSVIVPSEVFGLTEDYDLTPSLARFLDLNKNLIDKSLPSLEEKISFYRRFHRKQCRTKAKVLSYRFLTFVYDQPRDPHGLAQSSIEFERDKRVRQLMRSSEAVFKIAYDRLAAVSTSPAATWWYIFWDDLWRRNHDTISGLQTHAKDFNPHYRTSIAYTPLPRQVLESFLTQRGLLHSKPKWSDFFHAGFLNKLYLRLNDAVFRDSSRAIVFHLGNDGRELDMEDIDILTQAQSSTLGTGGGTDHDASNMRPRPTYRWEGLLSDPPGNGGHERRRKWLTKMGAWFGITPLWRAGFQSYGISLDVKVENGRYVQLHDDHSTTVAGNSVR
ncbi:hypothetical protein CVT24_000535 [Panaeolus cyanescens]|uniref:Uncharacterized protein n=1 Tax=Panaeolus cyanescens TaxID=181874 RepID=A0A409V8H6_9AGAR|nr:hypothetical protein CVT24_000535 [Panaeolus cyanescens]